MGKYKHQQRKRRRRRETVWEVTHEDYVRMESVDLEAHMDGLGTK